MNLGKRSKFSSLLVEQIWRETFFIY